MTGAAVELAVAAALIFLGGYGLSEGLAAVKRGIYLRDVWEQMPCVGIGVTLIFLGCFMAAQALSVLHP